MPKKGNAQTAHLDPCEVPSPPPPGKGNKHN